MEPSGGPASAPRSPEAPVPSPASSPVILAVPEPARTPPPPPPPLPPPPPPPPPSLVVTAPPGMELDDSSEDVLFEDCLRALSSLKTEAPTHASARPPSLQQQLMLQQLALKKPGTTTPTKQPTAPRKASWGRAWHRTGQASPMVAPSTPSSSIAIGMGMMGMMGMMGSGGGSLCNSAAASPLCSPGSSFTDSTMARMERRMRSSPFGTPLSTPQMTPLLNPFGFVSGPESNMLESPTIPKLVALASAAAETPPVQPLSPPLMYLGGAPTPGRGSVHPSAASTSTPRWGLSFHGPIMPPDLSLDRHHHHQSQFQELMHEAEMQMDLVQSDENVHPPQELLPQLQPAGQQQQQQSSQDEHFIHDPPVAPQQHHAQQPHSSARAPAAAAAGAHAQPPPVVLPAPVTQHMIPPAHQQQQAQHPPVQLQPPHQQHQQQQQQQQHQEHVHQLLLHSAIEEEEAHAAAHAQAAGMPMLIPPKDNRKRRYEWLSPYAYVRDPDARAKIAQLEAKLAEEVSKRARMEEQPGAASLPIQPPAIDEEMLDPRKAFDRKMEMLNARQQEAAAAAPPDQPGQKKKRHYRRYSKKLLDFIADPTAPAALVGLNFGRSLLPPQLAGAPQTQPQPQPQPQPPQQPMQQQHQPMVVLQPPMQQLQQQHQHMMMLQQQQQAQQQEGPQSPEGKRGRHGRDDEGGSPGSQQQSSSSPQQQSPAQSHTGGAVSDAGCSDHDMHDEEHMHMPLF
eukprot:m51a1_g7676 hypothetical protein (734) ;mRNA; f:521244-524609